MTQFADASPSDAPPRDENRPSAGFWIGTGAGWAVLVALGLVLPLLGRLSTHPNFLLNMLGYALAALAMICAAALLALMICRVRLPQAWWMHRVLGRNVNEFQGLFFVGGRIEGLSEQAHNAVFSAEEHMHRWDIAFGLTTMVLIFPHGGAAILARSLLTAWYFPA